MRTTAASAILALPFLSVASPILSPRIPTETATLTFFTVSSPRCSRQNAAYSEQHYVFTSISKCRDLQYDLGSPYKYVEISELSSDFAGLGLELVVYSGVGCGGEVVSRVVLDGANEDGHGKEGSCPGIKAGRSVKVEYAGTTTGTTTTGTKDLVPEAADVRAEDLGPDLQAKAVASDDTTAAVIEKEGVVAGDPRYSGSYDPQKRGPTDEDEEEEEADDEEDDKKSKKKKVTCGPVNSNCNAVEKDSTGRDD